jgi:glyoxylase-like metal-dependent hydrolase (beta-lactamase superfamily II)/rhodanese-related sulfurtransferase
MDLDFTIEDLNKKLTHEDPLFIIDVRTREVFNQGHIEGKKQFSISNYPFYDMVNEGGKNEPQESIKSFIHDHLLDLLPKKSPIFVVCYKGNSSKVVTKALQELGFDAKSIQGGMNAWSKFYRILEIPQKSQSKIYQIQRLSRGCLSYIVVNKEEALIIDPAIDQDVYLNFIEKHNLMVKAVIDTHMHADHISSGKVLSTKLNAPYFLHPFDAIHPLDMLPSTFTFDNLTDNQTMTIGNSYLKVIHVPGHTLGNVCLLLDEKVLFSGDSIFIESIARPDLGGKAETWTELHYHSLQKLLKLSDDTLILPSHFGQIKESNQDNSFANTLKDLKNSNKDLQIAEKPYNEFYDFIMSHLPKFPKEYIEIKRVNLGLLKPSIDEAEVLEQGKNICALGKVNK